PRDGAADDVVHELVAFAGLARDHPDLGVPVLAAAAGLLDVAVFALRRARHRFLVRDLRLADRRLDVELALQAVDDDLEVQLAHPADDRLTGLEVGVDPEG